MMSFRCSECGGTIFPKDEPAPVVPSTTPGILARYHRLAKCNEPPESAEKSFIQAVASQTVARLARLDDEISRLKNQLGRLEAEQAELSDYQRHNVAILSPLRRVPPEILAEMFSWTLPTSDMDGTVADLGLSQWVVSRVSSRWRATALATPLLWSTIFVCFGKAYPPSLDMVKAQMDRSRSLNLKIHFFGSEEGDSASQIEIFLFLSQQSDRWEYLTMQLTSNLAPRLNVIRGCLSSLRRLWIQWDNAGSALGIDSIECFGTAPLLVEAGCQSESHFISMLLPAHQLTCYRANGPWEDHKILLKNAHHLVEASIFVQFPWWQSPGTDGEVIVLPHLRHLFVSNAEILDHLRAPTLVELAIRMLHGSPPMLNHLGPFFDRSSCAPHRLCLRGALDASSTAAILQQYAFINSLRLVIHLPLAFDDNTLTNVVNAHITLLTIGETHLFPHLVEISFGSQMKAFPIDYPLFHKMLMSRSSPQGKLKTAAFLAQNGPMPKGKALAALDELRRSGLRLTVEEGPKARNSINGWSCGATWSSW
ncbi:hypothetical protein FB45DRAFT_1005025 [Roridomyces roridus]|uniref:F-box domain-containing protein n=1 Tax=Roridomyces roridus TaxID=1738132 RepID=A0AAD7BN50_9AGAR|nr:hypothetical protein FB45DRAFT_1005025 [Roridomyces roridus]